jgi:cytochrome c-type biogenesis protein
MSYISQAAGEREDQQAALPTLAFAAGLAAVFCTLGVVVATLGGIFGGTSGNNVFLPVLSNGICLAMGLQLLGFVKLPLPSFDFADPQKKAVSSSSDNGDEPVLLDGTGQILNNKNDSESEQASLFRTFLLGGSSALVASPCATPVLTSILAYVANAQNAAFGALLLLVYTLGYSTPLLIVASTGGQALVQLRQMGSAKGEGSNVYGSIAPWVTPLTGGVLLWYGMNGLLVLLFGDPSLAGLGPIL